MEIVKKLTFPSWDTFLGSLEMVLHGPFASLEFSTAVPLIRPWSTYLGFFFCLFLSVSPSNKCFLPLRGLIGPLGGDLRQNQEEPTKLSLTRGLYRVLCQDSFEETGRSQCRSALPPQQINLSENYSPPDFSNSSWHLSTRYADCKWQLLSSLSSFIIALSFFLRWRKNFINSSSWQRKVDELHVHQNTEDSSQLC